MDDSTRPASDPVHAVESSDGRDVAVPDPSEEASSGTPRSWNPRAVRRWHGPQLHEGHGLLTTACLAGSTGTAVEAWRRWLEWCDFDHEDSGSYELAAVAVERLGTDAGESSEAARCRGWLRRARVVSTLALDAARRAGGVVLASGHELVAVGDLAESPETRLPIRAVELLAVGVPEATLQEARAAASAGPAASVLESGRLAIGIGPNAAWHGRWLDDAGGVDASMRVGGGEASVDMPWRTPSRSECVAMLLARGWRWGPPGGPRWVLSIHRLLTATPAPESEAIADAAARDGTVSLCRAATDELAVRCRDAGEVSPGMLGTIEALQRALRTAPNPVRQRWRAARITRPPSWGAARLVDRLRRLVGPPSR